MHSLDRGRAPRQLVRVRRRLTRRWVEFYQGRSQRRPTDAAWRDFHEALAQAFHHLCGYCEETCRGGVDHFRPKSRFPRLVYEWSNWIFACHACNGFKGDKWPAGGYVDPCAGGPGERAEDHFEFDLISG